MANEVGSLYAKLGLESNDFKNGLRDAESTADVFRSALTKIFGAISLAVVVREITNFAKSIVSAASESEVAAMNLKRAVENSGASWEEASGQLNDFLAAEVRLTGYDDETAARSLANLTDLTGSYESALKLLPLAMDLARGKGMDLASASEYVGRAAQGNATMLARQMGILTSTTNATELLAEAQRRYGGYAMQYANSQAGAVERLQIVWGNLKETLGNALLPLTSSVATALASLGDSLTPQLEVVSENIRNWAITQAANMFYWGANMVQSLANGIIGSSAVVNALNQLGNYFTYMLEAHSPPRLLPELDTWGANAAKAYFEGWAGVTPVGTQIMEDWGKSLQPFLAQLDRGGGVTDAMRKTLGGRFGSSAPIMTEYLSAYDALNKAIANTAKAQGEYDEAVKSGDTEAISGAEEKLGKAKKTETQERARFAAAQSRVRAEAESQAMLRLATQQQTQAVQAQTAAIQQQAAVQSDASEKALNAARLAWQMAQVDTAGKIQLLEEESKKYAEGSVEWYQYQTQKINMEKQLQQEQESTAGGAAASVADVKADLSVLKDTLKETKSNLVDIGSGLFIDPLTMQISEPPPNLWDAVQNLGTALSNGFMTPFIKRMWERLKTALGMDPNATLGENLVTFGQKLGTAIGDAIYTAITEKIQKAFDDAIANLAPEAQNKLPEQYEIPPADYPSNPKNPLTFTPLNPERNGEFIKSQSLTTSEALYTTTINNYAPTAAQKGANVINIYTRDAKGVVRALQQVGAV